MPKSHDALYTLAAAGLLSDVAEALHSGHFALARVLSEAHWCLSHAALYRARGYTDGARQALGRAAMLAQEAEAIASDNAVTRDAISGVRLLAARQAA